MAGEPLPALVLASASPRRRDLLEAAGARFEVLVSHADETLEGRPDPAQAAESLARMKALAVAESLPQDRTAWVLGADTVVALGPDGDATLLGKPADEGQARSMLESLSGTRHRVITGVCVVRWPSRQVFLDSECTHVTMRQILPQEVQDYVESGEWQDKAGGYAIQENADAFVECLEGGGFDNVVGLPVNRVFEMLRLAGLAMGQDGS
ncbi:MAG: Maf family protein [Planctomycetota bacterium]|nr:Maf family protein [Planctomycetota bacterium]